MPIAIFSGSKGSTTEKDRHEICVSIFGGSVLDLTSVHLEHDLVVDVVNVFGSVVIKVRPDTLVVGEGHIPIFGAFLGKPAPLRAPNSFVVKVRGVSTFGAVKVTVVNPPVGGFVPPSPQYIVPNPGNLPVAAYPLDTPSQQQQSLKPSGDSLKIYPPSAFKPNTVPGSASLPPAALVAPPAPPSSASMPSASAPFAPIFNSSEKKV
mmetsp:Transcript_33951/g.55022  ORF Transcript_33951/g.55022 Transcript_33951/m.55022 type:complete len:207 (-) Transcript_33951:114-734(-)|eukprot:CAMPEP_0184657444 /NCGR_PEP_ID=MMETSP0308-20130426/19623_1 /TAXON_ID=38269 /ORGANISM="Gloeochaete witrockiana, Strain SAG 46.84" /LENGTH=206 /DNA_ID=CAMNT_0027095279 /DNA_START=115 /DNA_END=735 /DNA_ORIENTATION=-